MPRLLRLVIRVAAALVDCKSEKYQSALTTHFQSQSAAVVHLRRMDQIHYLVHTLRRVAVVGQMDLPLQDKLVEVVAVEVDTTKVALGQMDKVRMVELGHKLARFTLEEVVAEHHRLDYVQKIHKVCHRAEQACHFLGCHTQVVGQVVIQMVAEELAGVLMGQRPEHRTALLHLPIQAVAALGQQTTVAQHYTLAEQVAQVS
jgi:hypothetical protein